ncbi:hypothetical protein B7R54_03070 [Subtercola boreus]|uniref:Polysaccharide biosynthesis protein C-terminal domain-containing protein n=2 Tax=Subtercola boreus TaxID=120213 RepID=A0A3E0VHH3_9MICO|nr:hypothetical protein B7R54_03070 [Subtercola boreus]TQL54781.1 O-antigen/teichoic acid export membrane protein [Subtercola boreus]
MIAGRGVGFLWTILLLSALGLGDYGIYATACAFAAIISAPLENVFVVRSVRVDTAEYERERSTRLLLGVLLIVAGVVLYPFTLTLAFALVFAGGEMVFNAYKSLPLRNGQPAAVMRLDALRQFSSIGAATIYLFAAGESATLPVALALYLAPYAVVLVLSAVRCWGTLPAVPGGLRENVLLLGDAFIISLYLQGDIVLLGILSSDETVGAYSVASQIALALSVLGQLYAQSFNVRLRESHGDPAAGPRPKFLLGLAAFFALGSFVVGVLLILVGWHSEIGVVLLVMSLFAGLRTIDNAWTTVLYIQHRDGPRIAHAGIALALKFAGILLLILAAGWPAALAAAVAAVLAEAYLCLLYTRLVHRPLPQRDTIDEGEAMSVELTTTDELAPDLVTPDALAREIESPDSTKEPR